MRIDVVLLLYNRPDHSLAVLDSLIANGVAEVRAFLDFSDDPRVCESQERLLAGIAARDAIKVDLKRQTRRLGLAASVRTALSTTLAEADAAIVLEDDCVVRPGGIDFFREGLSALRYDRRIRSLCGYLFPCPFIRGDTSPLLLRRFSTWGWATWRDRWADYRPDLAQAVQRLEARNLRIDDLGRDLAALCRRPEYLENRVDVWSLPWALEHFLTGTFAVYPCDSVIDNIGFDGTGQNCVPSIDFTAGAPSGRRRPWDWRQLVHLVENEDMLRRFLSEHGLKTFPSSPPAA
jgi:hypothetical protein